MRRWSQGFFAALLAAPVAISAQDLPRWGTVSGWEILVAPAHGGACLMETRPGEDLVLRLGLLPDEEAAFIDVFGPDWTGIAEGDPVSVAIGFDGLAFDGPATGRVLEGRSGARVRIATSQMVFGLTGRRDVTVKGPDGTTLTAALNGLTEAVRALQDCQTARSGG